MANENESTIADVAGPNAPESPVKSPADVPDGFRLKRRGGKAVVYLIRCEGFLKIGVAGDPRWRLSALQTGCPFELELVAYRSFIWTEYRWLRG